MVEHRLPKPRAAGSNPVFRSISDKQSGSRFLETSGNRFFFEESERPADDMIKDPTLLKMSDLYLILLESSIILLS